jgi:hypothetical protein
MFADHRRQLADHPLLSRLIGTILLAIGRLPIGFLAWVRRSRLLVGRESA